MQGKSADGLSVVLPTFNLQEAICSTVDALRAELQPIVPALEFIVVDDGSSDGTAAAVTNLLGSTADVRLLQNQRNFGKGVAVYVGVLAAKYPLVCFTDADLPFSPGSYARVVRRLLLGSPFVVASRRLPESQVFVPEGLFRYAARRRFVGVCFNYLVRASLGLPFTDTQCGLKAFQRSIGIQLFSRIGAPRFLFDVELLLAARRAQVPVDEVPVCMVYQDAKSSVKFAGAAKQVVFGMAKIWAHERRGRYTAPNPRMAPETVRSYAREIFAPDAPGHLRATSQ